MRDLDLKRKISRFDVHCTQWESGCKWVGQVQSLGGHNEVCGHQLVPCPKDCSLENRFFRKDIDYHISTQCPKRSAICEHCGAKGTYQWMTENHYYQCEKIVMPCENDCGEVFVHEPEIIEQHNRVCTHAVIECPFAKVGCKEHVIRLNADKHQQDSVQQHLLCTMLSLQLERERNELERKTHQVMVEKMRAVSSHIDSLITLCPLEQQQPLRSIRSVLDEKLYSLKTATDKVYLRVESCSKLNEKPWVSPPFYVYLNPKEDYGYKMCVELQSSGDLSLYLLKGEYDHLMIWPVRHALKLHRWRGIQVSLINLKFKMEMEQSRTSIAGRLLNLKYFAKDHILSCQRVGEGSIRERQLIETIRMCSEFVTNSVDDAIEFSLSYYFV